MRDHENPDLALQTIDTGILAAAARGDIDLNQLAMRELANRGLDFHGRWVGFDKAAELTVAKILREAS